MKKIVLGIFVCLSMSCLAQDPEFSQFYANPLYLNPAFAGSARCPRLALNYRNQWPSLQGTFVTYSASYDQHVDALSGGLGLLVLNDNEGQGTITTTSFSGIYSYQLTVNRDFSIMTGFQGTYMQKSLDWSKLTFGDMIDPRYGFIYPTKELQPASLTKSFVDFSAGILAYSNTVFGGVAVNHLTQPDESFLSSAPSPLPMKITGHVGAMIPLEDSRDGSYLSPNVLYQQQGNFRQLNIGMYLAKSPLVGGIWFRTSNTNADAIILLVGLQQGVFKFGYSYDVTISQLSSVSGGAHELSMGLQFTCHPKHKRFRPVKCPTF